MNAEYFQHPHRFPKNATGAFYTTGHQSRESGAPDAPLVWCGDCLWCEAPEAEAPELLAPLDDTNIDTYFLRQPATPEETDHAIMALGVCCVSALRYGGKDRSIIEQLQNNPELCDYIIDNGELRLTIGPDGELLPFAVEIVRRMCAEQVHWKKWWKFWR